ncbi:MAG: hypothetical protein LBI64_03625 [Coriobacteriales bacterium]|nr:hypothetical protein [Coriobacteriales bacterium]
MNMRQGAYHWDKDGNLVSRGQGNSSLQYAWDAENRLRVVSEGGLTLYAARYGGDGARTDAASNRLYAGSSVHVSEAEEHDRENANAPPDQGDEHDPTDPDHPSSLGGDDDDDASLLRVASALCRPAPQSICWRPCVPYARCGGGLDARHNRGMGARVVAPWDSRCGAVGLARRRA